MAVEELKSCWHIHQNIIPTFWLINIVYIAVIDVKQPLGLQMQGRTLLTRFQHILWIARVKIPDHSKNSRTGRAL